MCAVIGAYLENPGSEDLNIIANVFRESSIRGLHATGVSWVYGNRIHTMISATPAGKFMIKYKMVVIYVFTIIKEMICLELRRQ